MRFADKVIYWLGVLRRVIFIPISVAAVALAVLALVCAYGFGGANSRVHFKRRVEDA